jgi:hypothetical protein
MPSSADEHDSDFQLPQQASKRKPTKALSSKLKKVKSAKDTTDESKDEASATPWKRWSAICN